MKVRFVGKGIEEISALARAAGLEIDDARPEVVVCHGGDGTLLGAERDFPNIPKLALRLDSECRKCQDHRTQNMLERLAQGDLEATRLPKIEARLGDRRTVGLNDVMILKANLMSAVRYKVWIGEQLYSEEIVADGLVAATPFGSSGYYRSITHSVIRAGMGLAFNNSTEPIDHIVLHEGEKIRVAITRGPALLGADNDPDLIPMDEGDEALIERSASSATVLAVDTLLCNNCARLDGRKWNRHGGLLTL